MAKSKTHEVDVSGFCSCGDEATRLQRLSAEWAVLVDRVLHDSKLAVACGRGDRASPLAAVRAEPLDKLKVAARSCQSAQLSRIIP